MVLNLKVFLHLKYKTEEYFIFILFFFFLLQTLEELAGANSFCIFEGFYISEKQYRDSYRCPQL